MVRADRTASLPVVRILAVHDAIINEQATCVHCQGDRNSIPSGFRIVFALLKESHISIRELEVIKPFRLFRVRSQGTLQFATSDTHQVRRDQFLVKVQRCMVESSNRIVEQLC